MDGKAPPVRGQVLAAIAKMLGAMADVPTASRLLTLLSLLQGRRDWPGGELAARLGVSGRTVRRDVERLRDLGYPVESLSGRAGGYTLRAGTAMPPLLLDDDEAIAIAVGLRTAARTSVAGIEETALRALVKLEQVLPAHLRRRVQALSASTSVLPARGGPTVDPQCLTLLAAAARDHEQVRFAYRGRDGAETRRTVEPHALVALGQRWYLVAFDPARGAWRTFRVDRVSSASGDGGRFRPRTVPGRDPAAFVTRGLAGLVYRHEARVTYHAPASEVRRRMPWASGAVEPLDEGTCALRTSDDDVDWLALRLAMAGVDFTVDGPPELVTALERLAGRVAAAAAGARAPGA
jgi:predicted DNA-binding transcriptional regulator YafY